jgi:hypothetical protein
MAPNRIVALATPLAAPLAGAFAAWLSQHVPGAEAQREAIEETFLGVTGLVMALALQFNHNRFKWDVVEGQKTSGDAVAAVAPVGASADADDIDDDILDTDFDDEDLLAPDDDVLEDEDPLDEDDELDGAADGVLLEGDAEQEARDLQPTTNASPIR